MRIFAPRAAAVVGVSAALALALTGCSRDSGTKPEEQEEQELGAIDQLYQDIYGDWSEEDSTAQQTRMEEIVAECMAEQGFDYTPVDYSSMGTSYSSDDLDVEWGTLEFAKEYGYGMTTDPWGAQDQAPPEQTEEFADPNQDYVMAMSESEQQAYYAALAGEQMTMDPSAAEPEEVEYNWETAGCQGRANHQVYEGGIDTDEFASLQEELNGMYEQTMNDPRMAELNSEWASCMADAGYTGLAAVGDAENTFSEQVNALYENAYTDMPPDATEEDYAAIEEGIADERAAMTANEIETAVADFTCREEVRYDEVQSEINLENQQEFYDTHKAELEAWAEALKAGMSGE